jgi:adsorption protein A
MNTSRSRSRHLCALVLLAGVATGASLGPLTPPAEAGANLLRDWRQFRIYPHLSRGIAALRRGQPEEAERQARHILNRIDSGSQEARLLLADALVAQRRFGNALDALAPLPVEPRRREIQRTWLNGPEPVPAHRLEAWLRAAGSQAERDGLAVAYSEELRRRLGAAAAWAWLRPRGGSGTYRSGLAELARDWRAVVAELEPLAQRATPLPALLRRRLELARRSLSPAIASSSTGAGSATRTTTAVARAQPPPPPSLDLLSFRLIKAGRPAAALELLEARLDADGQGDAPIREPLASRLVDLYGMARPPTAKRLAWLAPRLPAPLRGVLYEQLANRGHCDRLPPLTTAAAEAAAPGEWVARAECSITKQPGKAVIYLRRAEALGWQDNSTLLGFALAAAGEPEPAYAVWSALPQAEQQQPAVQAGMAQVALELGRSAQAEAHWQHLKTPTLEQWRLGGLIAQARGDLTTALARFRRVLAASEDGADFYQAGLIARAEGDRELANAWLLRATELSPSNARYLSDYGFTLSQDPDRVVRDTAIPVLLRAQAQDTGNAAVAAELANRYREQGNRQKEAYQLATAIQLEQNAAHSTEDLGSTAQRQRVYGLKRTYEALTRNDSWLLNVTVSPDGAAQTVDEALIGINNSFIATALYERQLPVRRLFAYGRVIGAQDISKGRYQTAGGVGLRWAPITNLNLNLFTEAYQGQIGQADSSDLLLRTTASFLDQGDWSAEWREDRRAWNERALYVDTAWFVNQQQTLSVLRYSQGRTWRLGSDSAQTISPYLIGQLSQQNDAMALRVGAGLRWQLWFDDDALRAYRRKLTLRGELQQSLAGDLFRNSTGVVFSIQADL